MACKKINQSVLEPCRNSQPGLVGAIYLANYSEVLGFSKNAGGDTITGVTMSGMTKFYKLAINKQSASFIDTGSYPKLTFKLQGWNAANQAIFNSPTRSSSCFFYLKYHLLLKFLKFPKYLKFPKNLNFLKFRGSRTF